jgi:hypothetical protein
MWYRSVTGQLGQSTLSPLRTADDKNTVEAAMKGSGALTALQIGSPIATAVARQISVGRSIALKITKRSHS